jgi:hypothetical protein
MSPQSLRKITVPTPGTAVPLVSTPTKCARIRVETPSGNTGNIYFGIKSVVGSTNTGVISVIAKGTGYEIQSQTDSDLFHAEDYALDAATANDGAYVTLWS